MEESLAAISQKQTNAALVHVEQAGLASAANLRRAAISTLI